MVDRHTFTIEESKKGGQNRGKLALKLQKLIAKQTGIKIETEMVSSLLTNPAVIGTILYIAVGFLRPNDKPAPITSKNWLQTVQNVLFKPGFNAQELGLTAETIGIDALQAALLAYIASGGNLAGVLSSAGGVISKLLPAAAAGA